MKIFRGMLSLVLIGVALSCDAPRLNPLDPLNPGYQLASIEGTIQTAALPHQPIEGVKVYWKNQNLLVETNAAGKFLIDQLPQKQGWIYFEKNGYSNDSLLINLINQRTQHIDATLNAIPQLDSLVIYTSVVNRYPTVQSDTLYVKAKISDLENDIATVFIRCTELNINKSLSFKSSSGFYENKFTSSDLNLTSMDEGIGKNFEISVYNAAGKEFKIGFSTIKRTIRQDIIFKSPANLEIVNKPIKFVWNRFLPGFNFSYNFEIYTEGNSPKLVFGPINFSKEKVEFTADITEINNLPAGQYFWVIWVIDDFQNRARSLPASFVVQ
ncbi:MAG: hypothetical protein NTX65_08980 [Ignavibacteriales bacterium]|nr:hypothetical protein [Ignavibacteriales bacterium]